MSTATLEPDNAFQPPQTEDTYEYRAIHTGAIVALLIALMSLVFPLTVTSLPDAQQAVLLAVAPLAGLLLSAWALAKINAAPELYTGRKAAIAGLAISAFSLIVGGAYGGYVYATEVPEGYARTSFLDLQPNDIELSGNRAVPVDIEALLGKKVFIKGFIRPDSTGGLRNDFKEFLLVRDNNQCCFGDMSDVKYYDQVAVNLSGKLTADMSRAVQRVGGVLAVRPGNVQAGEPVLVYMLEADYME